MRRQASLATLFAGASTAFALAACGGGDSKYNSPPPAPPPTVDASGIAAADPGSALPAGWQHGAFMEIFVRSYQDSNGDGKGDLPGLISRLDYLHDLGVRGIWLMPITASEDHDHGYAVSDYRNVEATYGTLADFDRLIAQAHARGIGVIVDYVMNHSAAQNPLFENSSFAPNNAYRDWYVWQAADQPGWNVYGADTWHASRTGWYYGEFWSEMPDFDLTNPAVVAYHHDSQRFWLNHGVDGFRFDAVGNFVENGPANWLDQSQDYTLMHDVRTLLNGYAQRYLVCEATGDPAGFGDASVCGGAFAFDLNAHLIRAAQGNAADIQAVASYFNTAPPGMATMLSNHDSFAGQRAANQLGGDVAKLELAAGSYLLLPGTPFIYYGEEIGMTGSAAFTGDPALRTPMSWSASTDDAGFSTTTPYRGLSANVATRNVAAEIADPNSLYTFYKTMLALRNARPSIATGGYEAASANGQVMSFQRASGAQRTLVVINYGSSTRTADVASLPTNATLTALYPADSVTATASAGGVAHLTIAAQQVRVFDVTP
ncbi:MAG: alpha-amylase family glycosyl hydrolase [Burkholderiaceae bacterium]